MTCERSRAQSATVFQLLEPILSRTCQAFLTTFYSEFDWLPSEFPYIEDDYVELSPTHVRANTSNFSAIVTFQQKPPWAPPTSSSLLLDGRLYPISLPGNSSTTSTSPPFAYSRPPSQEHCNTGNTMRSRSLSSSLATSATRCTRARVPCHPASTRSWELRRVWTRMG